MAHEDPLKNPFPNVFDVVPAEGPAHVEVFDTVDYSLHVPFGTTKFIFLMCVSSLIILFAFLWLARRVQDGSPPRGRFSNFLESLLVFVREQIAKPALGEHDYKKYLPFLWTMFLFIITLNLIGMLPFSGSPTAELMVSGALALIAFGVIHGSGVAVNGGSGYLKSFIPHIEGDDAIMKILAPIITVAMFFIEIMSAFIRGFVLAVRLAANMLAGHTVLFVLLVFIRIIGTKAAETPGMTSEDWLFWPVTGASVVIVTLLSLLELFVACLQAFVFTFLTATFIGMARHPEH